MYSRSIWLSVVFLFFWLSPVRGEQDISEVSSPPNINFLQSSEGDKELPKHEDYFPGPSLSFSQSGKLFMLEISQVQQWEGFRSLINEGEKGERWGSLIFSITPHIFGGKLVGEVEAAYSPGNDFYVYDFYTWEEFREYQFRLFRVALKGTWGAFNYGIEYFHVGDVLIDVLIEETDTVEVTDTVLVGNQEGGRMWFEGSFNAFHIMAFFSDSWDNVDRDPALPRIRNIEGGVSIDIAFPSWPTLSLSYTHGLSKSSREPEGFQPLKNLLDTFSASLYYGGSIWDVMLSSTYSLTKDRLQSDVNSIMLSYTLSGFYSPTDSITIAPILSLVKGTYSDVSSTSLYYTLDGSYSPTDSIVIAPSLGLGKETYRSPEGKVEYITPSVFLSFIYSSLFRDCEFIAYGSYTRYKGSDGFTDTSSVDGTASLVWNLGESALGKKTLSFDVSYYYYLDAIYPDSSYNEFSTFLTFKIASF